MKINPKKGLFLFAILVFPSFLYLFFSKGEHSIVNLPVYTKQGPVKTDGKLITSHGVSFPEFKSYKSAADADDSTFTVVTFAVGSCNADCDRVMGQIRTFAMRFEKHSDVSIHTYTAAVGDSLQLDLNKSIEAYAANLPRWSIRQVSAQDQLNFALSELMLKDSVGVSSQNQFANWCVVLDKANQIRAYYDMTAYTNQSKLVDAIKVLKFEDRIPRKKKR